RVWVLQLCILGEGHLDEVLVGLARADQSIVGPDGYTCRSRGLSPLQLLDDVGVRLLDESADLCECLAPPIAQFLDCRVNELRGRGRLTALRVVGLLHLVPLFG